MPPPGHEPFLRAICAEPEDDTVRLVYADWLDENGDPARAEFIRLQVRRANLKVAGEDTRELKTRDIKLREAHEGRWRRELPLDVRPETWQRFWRGFVSGATADVGYVLRYADTMFAAAPAQFVHVKRLTDRFASAFASLPHLRRVHGLTLSKAAEGLDWDAVLAGDNLANLRCLEVRFALGEYAARAITRAALPHLARVHVRGTVTWAAAEVLSRRFGPNATWDGVRG